MAFCEQCGSPVGESANFCRNCGNPMKTMNARVPVKVSRLMNEQTEQSTENVISKIRQKDWKGMLQSGVSTVKQWRTFAISWTKQKLSSLWHWKWGRIILPAFALILILFIALPVISNRVIGQCSYCNHPVKANHADRCVSCDRQFGYMVPILSVDGTEIIYEGEKIAEVNDVSTGGTSGWEAAAEATLEGSFDEKEDKFIPDYRPGYENTTGNFASNWNDGGNIMEQDGWIYYDFGSGLYKMPINGSSSDIVELRSEPVHDVNVLGDWIYCYSGSEILKIRTDGKEISTLATVQKNCTGIIVIDHYLFYCSEYQQSQNDVYDTLHRIDLKTLENKVILDEKNFGCGFGFMNAGGGYYTTNRLFCYTTADREEDFFWMDVEGNVEWSGYRDFIRGTVFDGRDWTIIQEWKEKDVNYKRQKFFSVYMWDEAEQKRYEIMDIGPVSREPHISSFGDYLVFSVYNEDEYEYDRGMFLINSKTGTITKVNGDFGYAVQYAGGYLYYHTELLTGVQYRCKLDGSDWSKIDWMCP